MIAVTAVVAALVGREFAIRRQETRISLELSKAGVHVYWSNNRIAAISRPATRDRFIISPREIELMSELRSLERVRLWNSSLDDEGFRTLCKSSGLRELNIGTTNVSSEGLSHLAQLKCLETLNLFGMPVDDHVLRFITSKDLQSLSIANTDVTGDGLAYMSSFQGLQKLWLMGLELKDSDLITIGKQKCLEDLWIDSRFVTDKGITHLTGLRSLTILRLPKTSITDACIEDVEKLRSLRKLSISHTSISTNGVDRLCNMNGLEELSVLGIDLSDQAKHAIKRKRPRLKLLTSAERNNE